ncbi:MAG: c-type cytochrome [Pseudomonadota bacterium]|nr:c-type cytochrome [Pseudomonadota bacterium]
MRIAYAAFLLAAGSACAETPVERGKYLATIAGCNDCHTPGGLLGQPDKTRILGGSDVGFGDPASGVWVGGNLTPDKETGLGDWTAAQIVAAITKGETPKGRKLSEIMPWPALSHLTPDDAQAIVAYLQSLPPVRNATPGPFKAGEAPTTPYVSTVIPLAQYMALPRPK